jgi:hypothetical protein
MPSNQEVAAQLTTVGVRWYQYVKGQGFRGCAVKKVTKALVILQDGTRISKRTHRDQDGNLWHPPSTRMVEESKEWHEAQKVFLAALCKLREVGEIATIGQLHSMTAQLEKIE